MFSDSAEEKLTLTMSELQMNLPRSAEQPSLPPTPPPPPLSSLKPSSTLSELVDFPENGFDFYSFSFDNSFPYRGILSNDRSFSCSSPISNTSFLSDMSFSTPSILRNSQDSGNTSDNFGLLTTTSTSFCGNDSSNTSDFQHLLNEGCDTTLGNNGTEPPPQPGGNFMLPTSQESQLLSDSGLSSCNLGNTIGGELGGGNSTTWDSPSKPNSSTPNQSRFKFSFPACESTITTGMASGNGSLNSSNGSSNASADSPTRHIGTSAGASGSTPCSFSSQWNSSDVSSLMDNQSPESSSSSSVITTSALGNSIWSPSSQVSAASTSQLTNVTGNVSNAVNKFSGDSQIWDENLVGLSKQDLLAFVNLLKEKLDESIRNGDEARSAQIQGAMLHVQNFIINSFVSESSGSVCSVTTPTTTIASPLLPSPTENSLDRAAKLHRDIAGSKDAPYTWRGVLPPRIHRNPTYSCKVFLGGLPWDITEGTLIQTFKPFGIVNIEWPGKEGVTAKPKGYAYAVFENEKQVKLLLQSCTHDYNHCRSGNYYYKISSKKYRGKDVQIIPWALSDSNFHRCQDKKIDPLKTIFVGALHGMINAEGLATIMQDLFGGVVYAGIDCDRKKYPIGSARVAFSNTRSYMKAVTAAFVVIKTSRFEKKLQVDPYLEDATCSVCNLQHGPYFCRDSACFTYFCRTCFQFKHSEGQFRNHSIMTRTTHNKSQQQQQQGNVFSGAYNGNSGSHGYNNNGGHHHQSSGYTYGGANNHPHNNHPGNTYHGFGGNNRQWNGSNNNIGRNTPPMNSGNCGTGPGALLGMNGCNKNYNNGGGQMNGGGGNSNTSNGHSHQQLPFTNRTFGQVGHRQQQQFMRW